MPSDKETCSGKLPPLLEIRWMFPSCRNQLFLEQLPRASIGGGFKDQPLWAPLGRLGLDWVGSPPKNGENPGPCGIAWGSFRCWPGSFLGEGVKCLPSCWNLCPSSSKLSPNLLLPPTKATADYLDRVLKYFSSNSLHKLLFWCPPQQGRGIQSRLRVRRACRRDGRADRRQKRP